MQVRGRTASKMEGDEIPVGLVMTMGKLDNSAIKKIHKAIYFSHFQ